MISLATLCTQATSNHTAALLFSQSGFAQTLPVLMDFPSRRDWITHRYWLAANCTSLHSLHYNVLSLSSSWSSFWGSVCFKWMSSCNVSFNHVCKAKQLHSKVEWKADCRRLLMAPSVVQENLNEVAYSPFFSETFISHLHTLKSDFGKFEKLSATFNSNVRKVLLMGKHC